MSILLPRQPKERMTSQARMHRAGFTLVELLVVIGIIGVLIGILLPVLGKARAAAARAVCMSNIRQCGTGIFLYCNDNKGLFPTPAFWDQRPAYHAMRSDWIYWQANRDINDSPIAHYLNLRDDRLKSVLRCPLDNVEAHRPALVMTAGQGAYFYSFAMSDALSINAWEGPGQTKITQWRNQSYRILLVEPVDRVITCGSWGISCPMATRHGVGFSSGRNVYETPGMRMGVNASAIFLDGHVDGISDDFACQQDQMFKE